MRTRSPSTAPPEKGEDGSTATTAARSPEARMQATRRSTSVDLPAPGGPVTPTTHARPVCGKTARETESSGSSPASTREMSRPVARASPALAAASSLSTEKVEAGETGLRA